MIFCNCHVYTTGKSSFQKVKKRGPGLSLSRANSSNGIFWRPWGRLSNHDILEMLLYVSYFNIPVNNFSIMSGWAITSWVLTSTMGVNVPCSRTQRRTPGDLTQDLLISSLILYYYATMLLLEPRREKTGLRGFRQGPTQTGLYKLRK